MIEDFLIQKQAPKLKFQRFEFKYIVEPFMVDKIIGQLLNYMDWDTYAINRPDKSYSVSSLYFDTANFTCYHQKMAGVRQRQKLRLRTYETDLEPKTPIFMEIKRRNQAIVFKDRLIVNYQDCPGFISTGQIEIDLKRGFSQERQTFKNFLWIKNRNCLLPKIMITYKRKPLMDKVNQGFRITFDYDIKAYPANKLFFSDRTIEVFPQKCIMELKYNNSIPAWFHRIIQRYQLERVSFSKYCRSLEKVQTYYNYA